MRIYVGFDDTDNLDADRGTGKVARWFKDELTRGLSTGRRGTATTSCS